MIRHTVIVLPPRKKRIKICNIMLNSESTGYHWDKKFLKLKKSENMFLQVLMMDMDTKLTAEVNYPEIYLEAYLYDESAGDYTKKYSKFKKNGVIVRPENFGDRDIKIKIVLKNQKKVIDQCLIDIV